MKGFAVPLLVIHCILGLGCGCCGGCWLKLAQAPLLVVAAAAAAAVPFIGPLGLNWLKFGSGVVPKRLG